MFWKAWFVSVDLHKFWNVLEVFYKIILLGYEHDEPPI